MEGYVMDKQDKQIILIVDDQENMCWILSKVLSEVGFLVKSANTAEEALHIAIANNIKISAAIIDYRLPDSNGFNLFLKLRKLDDELPCILITSYGSREIREKANELGFFAYFDKPFDNQALIALLEEVLKS